MRLLLPLLLAFTLAGCATTNGDPRDPWEGLNRKTYAFNDALDKAVMKPIAQGYQKVTPGFAQEGVNNFFENLGDVGTSINNLLQGKFKSGASDAGRFVVNTVFGVFGLWDIATPLGLGADQLQVEHQGTALRARTRPVGAILRRPVRRTLRRNERPLRLLRRSWAAAAFAASSAAWH